MGTKPKKKRAMRSVKSGVKTAELIEQKSSSQLPPQDSMSGRLTYAGVLTQVA